MKQITEEELAKELREHYLQNPPEGMTCDEVCDMSDDDLLDNCDILSNFVSISFLPQCVANVSSLI